jgi:hypothetical protein
MMAVALATIIALVAFLVPPPGHALARSQTPAQPSTPRMPATYGIVYSGVGSISFNNNIYVFVLGGSNNHLWMDDWYGSGWIWTDLGAPSVGIAHYGGVGVASYNNHLYVFVKDGNGDLWMAYGNRLAWPQYWQWYDRGAPSVGISSYIGVGAASYSNNLYVVVIGNKDEHLWVDYWNGSSWQWADQGYPLGGYAHGGVGVVSYTNNLYIYYLGEGEHLMVAMWDGSHWQWADQNTPWGGVTLWYGTGVASYNNNLYVFALGSDQNLWVDYWDGSHWQWSYQSSPGGGVTIRVGAGAVSYGQYLYDFVVGDNGDLLVDYWNGSSWQWADQGSPA